MAERGLLVGDGEQARHGLLDFIGDIVNDGVQPDVHLLKLRQFRSFALRADVEPHDDRVRGRRQQHVGFRDGADSGVNDLHFHFFGAEFRKCVVQDFDRALHVGLDDERELLDVTGGELLVELLEGEARGFGECRLAQLGEPVERDLPRLQRVFDHLEPVAGLRHVFQAQDLGRR